MATEYRGVVVPGGTATVHTGAGYVTGWLLSHDRAAAQQVVMYDAITARGAVVASVWVGPGAAVLVLLTPGQAIPFGTGLTVAAGACEAMVWAVGR